MLLATLKMNCLSIRENKSIHTTHLEPSTLSLGIQIH